MKKLARVCAILAAFLPLSAMAANNMPFSNIYAIGDSLTDIGNAPDTPITTPGGSIYVSVLASGLGLGIAPSNSGGTDYAYAGATTGPLPFPTSGAPIQSMQYQVQSYLSSTGGRANPNGLYVVWGGANDVTQALTYAATQSFTPAQTTAFGLSLVNVSTSNIMGIVSELHKAGANYFIVSNLPNLGQTAKLSQPAFILAQVYQGAAAEAAPTIAAGLTAVNFFFGLTPAQIVTSSVTIANYISQPQNPPNQAQILSFLTAEFPGVFAPVLSAFAAELYTAQQSTILPGIAAEYATLSTTLPASGTAIAQSFNNQLLSTMNASGLGVTQVDAYGLLVALQNNYKRFGFIGPYSSYLTPVIGPTGVTMVAGTANPSQYIFYDGYHPSAETDLIGAEYMMSVIEGPEYAGVLGVVPFSVVDNQNSEVQSELMSVQNGYVCAPANGQWRVFASGLTNPGSIDADGFEQVGYNTTNNAYLIGADYGFATNAMVGVAVGRSMGDVNYTNSAGGFDLDENLITAFGGYNWRNLYLTTELNYANVDFSNVKRNFNLGLVPETVIGDTTGQDYGAAGTLGFNFVTLHNALRTGPVATIDYQNDTVNPYSELSTNFQTSNGAFDALQYAKQTNASLVGGLGWQINYDAHISNFQLIPFVQGTYDHQFVGQDRMIRAGVTSLPGSAFEMPFTSPDGNYGLVDAGIQGILSDGVALTFGYSATVFEPQVDSQSFMISASVPL